MKALVLSFDKYRPITEHMLKTYEQLWPANPFTFRIPYQAELPIVTYGQRVELVRSQADVMSTMDALLHGLPDDEWIYWCIDDKFVLHIDAEAASYFTTFVQESISIDIGGLCFCRARSLLASPHVSEHPVVVTPRGDELLQRYNFNQIWLHQLLRVRVLRRLFAQFPRYDFVSTTLDAFTRQGPNALPVPEDEMLCVTRDNFLVLGESTTEQQITRTYVNSMNRWGLGYPPGFGTSDNDIVIGSLDEWVGE